MNELNGGRVGLSVNQVTVYLSAHDLVRVTGFEPA